MIKELLILTLAAVALAEELDHFYDEETELQANPEEGDLFEGDMELTYNPFARNMKLRDSYRWPNAVVYYEVVSTGFSSTDLSQIQKAFDIYHKNTCIKWVKRTTQDYYVRIARQSAGCFATVGRVSRSGNPQRINLGNGCTTRIGTVVHEMMHCLGFHHEQSRPDRDNYVTIMYDNIQAGRESNFRKYGTDTVTTLNTPYDYGSVMHYSATSFTKNGQKTIVPKQAGAQIGQRVNLSQIDINKLNAYYKCNGASKTTSGPGATTRPTTSRPVTSPPTGTSFSCNFESGTCGFTQSTGDNFEWTRANGPTTSANTGPSKDATTGSGFFMYTEASTKAAGQKAEILSPAIKVTAGKYALRFKYNMNGDTMGMLEAYYMLGSSRRSFFTQNQNKGDVWQAFCGALTVSGGSSTLRMGFVGTVGSSYRSDMAIDDVSMTPGDCSGNVVKTTSQPGTTSKPSAGTLFSCSFNGNSCSMSLAKHTTGFTWRVHKATTGSSGTGPTSDRLGSATGGYLYTEASGFAVGATASAATPYVKTATCCLEFSYHMYGATMGTMNIYFERQGASARTKVITKAGDQGNRWLRTRLTLNRSATNTIRFIFEGVRGSSFTSDLAIDDVIIRSGAC